MRYAFLFPGQGSHRVGMGFDLHAGSSDARALYKRADDLLGYSLSKLCFDGPDEELRKTIHTQPALYVTSCAALMTLWTRVEVKPFAVAGHSVGEYAALYAAGALTFDTGLELVRQRAELMQKAAEERPGTMAAVLGLDGDRIQDACERASRETQGTVGIANYNCPGQIVISGTADSVQRAGEIAKELGAKRVITLPVSGGFHSPLMVTAGDALYPALRDALFQNPRVPIVSNVSAKYTSNGVDIAPLLTMQVSGSVRWEESMRRLLNDGVRTFIEIGSGEVLSGLMKRIDPDARTLSAQDMAGIKSAVGLIEEMNPTADEAASAEALLAGSAGVETLEAETSEQSQTEELVDTPRASDAKEEWREPIIEAEMESHEAPTAGESIGPVPVAAEMEPAIAEYEVTAAPEEVVRVDMAALEDEVAASQPKPEGLAKSDADASPIAALTEPEPESAPAEQVAPAEPEEEPYPDILEDAEPAPRIYHVTKLSVWSSALSEGAFRPPSLETEGFIHASRPEQVAWVGATHFRGETGLVLLEIDAAKVKPEIRYEESEPGKVFPHIYGPLNADAIVKLTNFSPGPDGRFRCPSV